MTCNTTDDAVGNRRRCRAVTDCHSRGMDRGGPRVGFARNLSKPEDFSTPVIPQRNFGRSCDILSHVRNVNLSRGGNGALLYNLINTLI